MAIEKKSLIASRATVKKANVAAKPVVSKSTGVTRIAKAAGPGFKVHTSPPAFRSASRYRVGIK